MVGDMNAGMAARSRHAGLKGGRCTYHVEAVLPDSGNKHAGRILRHPIVHARKHDKEMAENASSDGIFL